MASLAVLGLLGGLNCYLLLSAAVQFRMTGPTDWTLFENAARLIASGSNPYVELDQARHLAFRWSPVAAWLLVPLTQLPFALWAVAHLAALVTLGDRRLAALIAISWPFALDTLDGGVLIFVAILAAHAVQGNRPAIGMTLALAIFIPRPLMIPVILWIVVVNPWTRIPFVVAVLVHFGAVTLTGWHAEWLERLLASGHDVQNVFNVSPSRVMGSTWLLIGVPLALWLTSRRHIGLACLAISPYVLPPYMLMLLLERVRWAKSRDRIAYEHS